MSAHRGKYIVYLRVSTKKQERSGLGLEGQRAAVATWLNGGNWEIVEEVIEVEGGSSKRIKHRPALQLALDACRRFGAKLLIAKLDRLSRDPVFLLSLRDAGITFVCCDNPTATRMTVGVLALAAEYELEQLSQRTKAALAAKKARGVKLGNPRPETLHFRKDPTAAKTAGIKGAIALKASADDFAALIKPLLDRELAGLSANATAAELNRRGVQTARGGSWTARSVLNLKERL